MEAYQLFLNKKESMNEEVNNSSEAKATYKWLRSQVIDTCDDLQREGYVLPKGVLNGDLQLTRDAVEMGIDNPVEVAESLLQYLKDQIRYCSFAQMDWLKEHYEDLRLTLKQYFSACERDQSMNYLDKNFPKMEAVSKERSYEKIDEAKMEDKWDRTSLGYYEGTKYVAYESKDGQTIQISSLHPYDDAEYYWASSKDGGKTYSIIKAGKKIKNYQAEPDAEYNDVVGELVSLNRDIKPVMMYEDVESEVEKLYDDEQVSEQLDSTEEIDVESEAKWPQVNELIGGRGKFIGKVDEYRDVPIYEYRTNEGQEIVYFLTGPSVLDDRFEFDAKDEEAVVNCIDAYKENGEEAADKFWKDLYYNSFDWNEGLTVDKSKEPDDQINESVDVERIQKVIPDNCQYIDQVDDYRGYTVHKYKDEYDHPYLFVVTSKQKWLDWPEFDVKDEDKIAEWIDKYIDEGEEAAQSYWDELYPIDESLQEARTDKSPKKYLYQLCNEVGWPVPRFTDPIAGGYRLRYNTDPEIQWNVLGSPQLTEERANELLDKLKAAAEKLGIKLLKPAVKHGVTIFGADRDWLCNFAKTDEERDRLNKEMMNDADSRGLTKPFKHDPTKSVFDWDKIHSNPDLSREYEDFRNKYLRQCYQVWTGVPGNWTESLNKDVKEDKNTMNKSKTALDRYKEMDDRVDEAVEFPQNIYSVSYTVDDGPYQAIMVRADSEEEAIKKFQKQNPDADVIAAGVEYDPEEMRRRGKPIMEEIEDDLSIRKWYMMAFPNDELGYEIKDDVTFNGLDKVLNDGEPDVYEYLGVADSIVRERVFDKLADLTGVDYDDIYEKWIESGAPKDKDIIWTDADHYQDEE